MIYLAPDFVPSQMLDATLECVYAIRGIFTISLSCVDFFISEGGFVSLGRVLERPWSDSTTKGALWLLKTASSHTQSSINPKESSRILQVLTKIFVRGVYQNYPKKDPECLAPVEVHFQHPCCANIVQERAPSETHSNHAASSSVSQVHVERPQEVRSRSRMKTSNNLHCFQASNGCSAPEVSATPVIGHNSGSLEGYHMDSGFFSYGCVPDKDERSRSAGSSSNSSESSGMSDWNQWTCSILILKSLMQTLIALLGRGDVSFMDFELQGGVEASITLMASCQVLV